jgi:hypothetical protein
MRYFFDLLDGLKTYTDKEGQDWPTSVAAGVCAARIARELACETQNQRLVVRVMDEQDRHLVSIPVRRFA